MSDATADSLAAQRRARRAAARSHAEGTKRSPEARARAAQRAAAAAEKPAKAKTTVSTSTVKTGGSKLPLLLAVLVLGTATAGLAAYHFGLFDRGFTNNYAALGEERGIPEDDDALRGHGVSAEGVAVDGQGVDAAAGSLPATGPVDTAPGADRGDAARVLGGPAAQGGTQGDGLVPDSAAVASSGDPVTTGAFNDRGPNAAAGGVAGVSRAGPDAIGLGGASGDSVMADGGARGAGVSAGASTAGVGGLTVGNQISAASGGTAVAPQNMADAAAVGGQPTTTIGRQLQAASAPTATPQGVGQAGGVDAQTFAPQAAGVQVRGRTATAGGGAVAGGGNVARGGTVGNQQGVNPGGGVGAAGGVNSRGFVGTGAGVGAVGFSGSGSGVGAAGGVGNVGFSGSGAGVSSPGFSPSTGGVDAPGFNPGGSSVDVPDFSSGSGGFSPGDTGFDTGNSDFNIPDFSPDVAQLPDIGEFSADPQPVQVEEFQPNIAQAPQPAPFNAGAFDNSQPASWGEFEQERQNWLNSFGGPTEATRGEPGPTLRQGVDLYAILDNLTTTLGVFPAFLSVVALIAAGVMGIIGLNKLIQHTMNPMQTPMMHSVLWLLGAGLMFALPFTMDALIQTLGVDGGAGRSDYFGEAAAMQVDGGVDTLDEIFASIMENLRPALRELLPLLFYVMGIFAAINGVVRLTRAAEQGPRGPSPVGTAFTFVLAAVLMAAPDLMDAVTESLFGRADINRYTSLTVENPNCPLPSNQTTMTLQGAFPAILVFLQLIGWIGFIRGFFILRAATDGNQQASVFGAFTHILGGALAVNFAPLIRAVDQSAGIDCFGM